MSAAGTRRKPVQRGRLAFFWVGLPCLLEKMRVPGDRSVTNASLLRNLSSIVAILPIASHDIRKRGEFLGFSDRAQESH
jgi:hypothetical protein